MQMPSAPKKLAAQVLSNSPPDRLIWLDFAKGIGIVLVVVGHAIRGLHPDIMGPRPNFFEVADQLIYSFHMPLFFFISGFLFGKRRSDSWFAFSRSMAIGIVVPYVLWSIIFVGLQNQFSSEVNHPYELSALFRLESTPIGHMWFLHALLIVQVIYFVARQVFGFAGLVAAGCVFSAMYFHLLHLPDPWAYYSEAPAMGGAFFAAGLIAVAWLPTQKSKNLSLLILVVATAIWLATALPSFDPSAPRLLVPIAAIAGIAGIAMTIAVCNLLPDTQWLLTVTLAQLGQASIAIFVAHTIFSAGLRIVLYKTGFFDYDFYVLTETLVGLIVPTALFLVANMYKVAPYVGFGRNQKSLYASDVIKMLGPKRKSL
jgi:fucose 4-O-acetylase-like acetyltransferase